MINKEEHGKITSEIGGIRISFLFDESPHEDDIKDTDYDNSTQVKLRVHHSHIPKMNGKEKIFDSGTWALYRSDGKYVLQDASLESDDSLESDLLPETIIILESDLKSGDVYIRNNILNRDLFPDPLGHPLNQILMIMLLSLGKGVLLHACGIDEGGYGYLFPGNSTHGKSTIAKLWSESGATVLNDDRIIIREKDGELWMYGTPWHGDFNEVSSNALPIRKIFFLRHGKENSAVSKDGAEAVSMLLTRSFPPLWDKKGMDYTLGIFDRIANKLPCYELNFLPDKKIIDFVRNI
jgi:hypothetical protein